MAAIDLFKATREARIVRADKNSPIPEHIRKVLLGTLVPELLERLATPPKKVAKGQGKGGNTNYSESVLKPFFARLDAKVEFHPNGPQLPPDAVVDGCEFEWKSIAKSSGNFPFNDSIPKGGRVYCFYVRGARRCLFVSGDVLALGMNEELVIRTHEQIMRARAEGKDDGLCFFYPRKNMFVRNFLRNAPANGYLDYDRGVIWTTE